MKCQNTECRSKNPRHATHFARCGEEMPAPGSRFSAFFTTAFGWVFVLAILYLNFGGIYFAFSRHGTEHAVIAIFVPPYAWYRAISPLWDTPKWQFDARDKIETLAYVVLHAQGGDPAMRADMAARIPKLQRLYAKQPRECRESLDHSLTAFIELMDAAAHDMVEDIVRRGVINLDKSEITRRHRTLYDVATKYDGLRAVLDATILDAEYVRSIFSLEDIKDIPAEKRAIILNQADSMLKRWKDGAIQTKDRILL